MLASVTLFVKQRESSFYYRPGGPLRESRGIALLFSLNLGTLDGGGRSTPRSGRLYPGKHQVHIVQEAGWVSEPVWIGAENLASTGIRSPDLPARGESLYRLCHPGSLLCVKNWFTKYGFCVRYIFGHNSTLSRYTDDSNNDSLRRFAMVCTVAVPLSVRKKNRLPVGYCVSTATISLKTPFE
jgi:hypothetical protein